MMSVMTSYRLMNLAGGLLALCTASFAQPSQVGRLDFLKSKDPTFALFANTSNTSYCCFGVAHGDYRDELVLLTGLPGAPAISARIDILGNFNPCSEGCGGYRNGGLRNVVLSPDGDTALVSSEPSGFP